MTPTDPLREALAEVLAEQGATFSSRLPIYGHQVRRFRERLAFELAVAARDALAAVPAEPEPPRSIEDAARLSRVDPEPRPQDSAELGVDPNGCGDPDCHPGCRNYPGPRPQDGGEDA